MHNGSKIFNFPFQLSATLTEFENRILMRTRKNSILRLARITAPCSEGP